MIIRDFDLHGTLVVGPPEANSVLDVDADAPLVVTVALEFFQAVAGRIPEVTKLIRVNDGIQLLVPRPLQLLREAAASGAVVEIFSEPIAKQRHPTPQCNMKRDTLQRVPWVPAERPALSSISRGVALDIASTKFGVARWISPARYAAPRDVLIDTRST